MKRFVMRIFSCAVPVMMLVSACGLKTSEMIDARTVNTEIKNRKIIRITEGDRQREAAAIAPLVMEDLSLAFDTLPAPCSTATDSLMPMRWAMLQAKMEVVCGNGQHLSGKAKKVWDAYQAGFAKGDSISANFQKLPTNEWLISIPKEDDGRLAVLNVTLGKDGLSKWVYMVKTRQVASPAGQ